jgi:peptidyl-prolyl cis-trans isomerase C
MKLFKDPLLHFLLIGAGLFVLFAWLDDGEDEEFARQIRIGAEQVAQARDLAALLRGRAPTPAEIEELLEPLIREQVLYREARALGLDRDDETVRLRLVEKMQFLTQDLAEPDPPDEDTLRTWFDEDPARFAIPARATFEQIYFSPRERGDALDGDVAEALAALRAGESRTGDSSPLQPLYSAAPYEQVEILFGEALADAMFSSSAGDWLGPFRSDFGVHLARLAERTPARQPSFDEVGDTVLAAWMNDARSAANEAEYLRMRERYEVVVDWPTDSP